MIFFCCRKLAKEGELFLKSGDLLQFVSRDANEWTMPKEFAILSVPFEMLLFTA